MNAKEINIITRYSQNGGATFDLTISEVESSIMRRAQQGYFWAEFKSKQRSYIIDLHEKLKEYGFNTHYYGCDACVPTQWILMVDWEKV